MNFIYETFTAKTYEKNKNEREEQKLPFNEPDEYKTEEVVLQKGVEVRPPMPMVAYPTPWWQKIQLPIVLALFAYGLIFRS